MSDETREAFESWARGLGYSVIRAPHGPYVWAGTANAWNWWQPAYETGLAANAQEVKRLRETLANIADADPATWEPDVRDQFREWAQNRARAALQGDA